MKKSFLFLGAMAMTCLFAPQAMAQNYELRVLSFEDDAVGTAFSGEVTGTTISVAKWSDMIDTVQYNGILYNGTAYQWQDGGNTELQHSCGLPFWGGGHVVSNYACNDLATYGDYTKQLTVYKADANTLVRNGGGHNGSDNFCIHYGYSDPWYYVNTQTLTFADGVARVIDHMYVNNTTYLLNEYINGGYCPKANAEDSVSIKATGYDANDQETKTIYFPLCKGNEMGNGVITEWTKWDMTELGAVVSVVFDIVGSDHLEGKAPAYFAYDDVAVRFTKGESTALQETNGPDNTVRKEVRNGRMTIIRDGKTYNAQGVQVR